MEQKNKPVKSDAKQEFLLAENIENLEKELADKYYQLGREIYEAADGKIGEINGLVDKLVDAKIRLNEAKAQAPCPYCLWLNPKSHKFCGKCGKELDYDEI